MNKKILILLAIICASQWVSAQRWYYNDAGWRLSSTFGATKFFNSSSKDVQENVNVGMSMEVTRVLNNGFFISAGTTFSTLKSTPLWENSLNYFSIDTQVGYLSNISDLTEYSLAAGTSFLSAPNTIDNANSSFSLNLSGGLTFWLNNTDVGIIVRNTYKIALNENYVSHNRFSLGLAYKL